MAPFSVVCRDFLLFSTLPCELGQDCVQSLQWKTQLAIAVACVMACCCVLHHTQPPNVPSISHCSTVLLVCKLPHVQAAAERNGHATIVWAQGVCLLCADRPGQRQQLGWAAVRGSHEW